MSIRALRLSLSRGFKKTVEFNNSRVNCVSGWQNRPSPHVFRSFRRCRYCGRSCYCCVDMFRCIPHDTGHWCKKVLPHSKPFAHLLESRYN
jgi:hypothetical protein